RASSFCWSPGFSRSERSKTGAPRAASQLRWVPTLSIIQNGIFAPTAFRFLTPDIRQVQRGVGERPVLPVLDITMTNGIVPPVIQGRPEVSLRFHLGFSRIVPNLATTRSVFAVPTE